MVRVVFDIGGTHMRVARAEGVVPSGSKKAATPLAGADGLETLVSLIERVAEGDAIEAIAGGVAGVVDKEGTILSSPNLLGWNSLAIGAHLTKHFSVPVRVENDASCAALGEALSGAGRGSRIVAHLRLGTGVGGARIVDGTIDAHTYGFEPGHQIVSMESGATLESLIGGSALAKKYGVPPQTLSREVWDALTPALAAGIWNVITLWSPDVIVLGGSLLGDGTTFQLADVRTAVEKFRQVVPVLPEIRVGTLGDEAGLYGAAALLSVSV